MQKSVINYISLLIADLQNFINSLMDSIKDLLIFHITIFFFEMFYRLSNPKLNRYISKHQFNADILNGVQRVGI